MVGAEQLSLLRDGAVLVNTARGSLVDHDALIEEAATGRIRVALDVTTPEPPPADSPLRAMPNVILTPHVAGHGRYGHRRIGDATVGRAEGLLRGPPGDRARSIPTVGSGWRRRPVGVRWYRNDRR